MYLYYKTAIYLYVTFLGYWILEPSHHVVRKPWQSVERPHGEELKPWPTALAGLPTGSQHQLASP